MKQYLPSRNFFIVILSIVLLSGGVFGYKTWHDKVTAERNKQAREKILAQAISHENIDSDGDGLLDWEEVFRGTDPKKADTDGDGTPDGKEIELRRNPLIPAPNDYVRTFGEPDQLATVSKEELTESEKLIRGMLTAIIYNPNPTDKNIANKITQGIANSIKEKGQEFPNIYSLSQIKTVPETEANLKTYGNTVGGILKNSKELEKENNAVLLVIAQGLKDGKTSTFDGFDPIIKSNKDQISALLKVSVPEDMAQLHVFLLNSMENVSFSIGNLKFLISDPLKGLIGMQQYKTSLQNRTTAREKVSNHLVNSGIVFNEGEAGLTI